MSTQAPHAGWVAVRSYAHLSYRLHLLNTFRRGGVAIQDWSDVLQPRLRGRLAFSDSPREFVGVALKTLGLPFNCSQAQLKASGVTLPQLKERLQQLQQQVTLYRSPCWMSPLLLRPAPLV